MICCLVRESASAGEKALVDLARACSPRVESYGDRVVAFDAAGLGRVLGPPDAIAREVHALALEQHLRVRVAIAATRVAAWLLAHHRPGVTVIDPAGTRAAVASLPIAALKTLPGHAASLDALATLARWGLRTLGQVAALPRADVRTRLGDEGVRLHQAACGEDSQPLVPAGEAAPFLERCILEWPIEGLQPLTFVLSRLCDALSVSLERADRGVVTLTTTLHLVTKVTHARTLTLPAPMRESRTLRTLIALDLESHPPGAAIDAVTVAVDVVPGRIVQHSLLDRAHPAPEQIATLTARLRALMGESRVGAPALVDTHDDRAVGMQMFLADGPARPASTHALSAAPFTAHAAATPRVVVRRFRLPIAARVDVERGGPVRVTPASSAIAAGRVLHRAGPWHASGWWWATDRTGWDRDEWDVELAGGACYRLARDRRTGHWEIDGEID
jgi:protein ImuB